MQEPLLKDSRAAPIEAPATMVITRRSRADIARTDLRESTARLGADARQYAREHPLKVVMALVGASFVVGRGLRRVPFGALPTFAGSLAGSLRHGGRRALLRFLGR